MKCVTSSTLSRMEYMAGRDTLHDSKTTDGQKSDMQSGYHENGQGRPKQDGKTQPHSYMGPA